jgi:hypothetical protein
LQRAGGRERRTARREGEDSVERSERERGEMGFGAGEEAVDKKMEVAGGKE